MEIFRDRINSFVYLDSSNHAYVLAKKRSHETLVRCRISTCPATAQIRLRDNHVSYEIPHNGHAIDEELVKELRFDHKFRKMSSTSSVPFSSILNECLAEFQYDKQIDRKKYRNLYARGQEKYLSRKCIPNVYKNDPVTVKPNIQKKVKPDLVAQALIDALGDAQELIPEETEMDTESLVAAEQLVKMENLPPPRTDTICSQPDLSKDLSASLFNCSRKQDSVKRYDGVEIVNGKVVPRMKLNQCVYVDANNQLYIVTRKWSTLMFLKCILNACPATAHIRLADNKIIYEVSHSRHSVDLKLVEQLKFHQKFRKMSVPSRDASEFLSVFNECLSELKLNDKSVIDEKRCRVMFSRVKCKLKKRDKKATIEKLTEEKTEQSVALIEEIYQDEAYTSLPYYRGTLYDSNGWPILCFVVEETKLMQLKDRTSVNLIVWTAQRRTEDIGNVNVLVVHAIINEKSHMQAYFVMENRSTDAFELVLSKYFRKAQTFSAGRDLTIISDMRADLVDALQKVFPVAKHGGCFHLYARAVYAEASHWGIVDKNSKLMRMTMAVLFLPNHLVAAGVQVLIDKAETSHEVKFMEGIQNCFRTGSNVYMQSGTTNATIEMLFIQTTRMMGDATVQVLPLVDFIKSMKLCVGQPLVNTNKTIRTKFISEALRPLKDLKPSDNKFQQEVIICLEKCARSSLLSGLPAILAAHDSYESIAEKVNDPEIASVSVVCPDETIEIGNTRNLELNLHEIVNSDTKNTVKDIGMLVPMTHKSTAKRKSSNALIDKPTCNQAVSYKKNKKSKYQGTQTRNLNLVGEANQIPAKSVAYIRIEGELSQNDSFILPDVPKATQVVCEKDPLA